MRSLDEEGMAKLMINKDLKTLAKLHHLHHLIKWGSNLAAWKAEKDIPTFVEATAEDDPSDAPTLLSDPAQRAMFEASGFDPEAIEHHVELFYGDTDDSLDPKMLLDLAERLPNCATHVWKGAGHYGFVDRSAGRSSSQRSPDVAHRRHRSAGMRRAERRTQVRG